MPKTDLINQIISTYQKYGWELKAVLLRDETAAELHDEGCVVLGSENIRAAALDALWFSRPSHNKGEAWELRLLAETAYALFQRFEADAPEEKRVAALNDMEERMIQYVADA